MAVKVPRAEVLDGKENVKLDMRRKLDEIASLTKAHLAIVGQVSSSIGFGLEAERTVEIVITGSYENVEQARVRLLVLLDEAVSGYTPCAPCSLQDLTLMLVHSLAFIQKYVKLITSCTLSSLVASDVSYKLYRKKRLQTYISQRRSPACLVQRTRH